MNPAVRRLRVLYQSPTCRNVQGNFVTYAKNKGAGILHAPFHIGEQKLSFKVSGTPADLQRYSQRNGMIAAVNAKGPVDLNRRTTLRRERPGHLRWRERGIRVLLALQDLLVHLPVARAVAALPALDVNYDQARGRSAGRIEVNQPALQCKGSMHSVKHVGKRKFDLCVRRIQFERHFLRPQGRRTTRDAENCQ